MYVNEIFVYVIGGLLSFGLCVYLITPAVRFVINYLKSKKEKEILKDKIIKLPADVSLKYNRDFLEFIKFLVTETTYIEFQKMTRGIPDISKVNVRARMSDVIEITTKKVYESMLVPFSKNPDLMLNATFFETYIIDVTTATVDHLLHRLTEEIDIEPSGPIFHNL